MNNEWLDYSVLQLQGIWSNAIRLDLDTTVANGWCEVDAIKVIGDKHSASGKDDLTRLRYDEASRLGLLSCYPII